MNRKCFIYLAAVCFLLCVGVTIQKEREAFAGEKQNTTEFNEKITDGLPHLTSVQPTLDNALTAALLHSFDTAIRREQEKPGNYTKEELMYLACIIYCEAGDQDFTGKVAVANVVMNRAKSKEFDHVTTIKEVIYDCARWGRQFSPAYIKVNGKWTTKGSKLEKVLQMYKTGVYEKDWQERQMKACINAADAALRGKYVLKGDYLYFNMNISTSKSKCEKNGQSYQIHGCHIFF